MVRSTVDAVKKRSKEAPVICFGLGSDQKELAALGFAFDKSSNNYVVNSSTSAIDVLMTVSDKRFGVIFLDGRYSVGVDFKFLEDAYVVILHKDKDRRLDSESLKQMLGRGSRANGQYQGDLFIYGEERMTMQIREQLKEEAINHFYDGATLLRCLTHVDTCLQRGKTSVSAQRNNLIKWLNEPNWRQPSKDVFLKAKAN